MSLVGLIEQCGRDVDSGQMGREAAVQRIQEFSDGGLTRSGAEHSLDRWRTIRAAYAGLHGRLGGDPGDRGEPGE